MSRVLIVGTPRSGTTWVGQTLGRARDAGYVHEPDGENEAFALKTKLRRPRHLELAPDDEDRRLAQLWAGAFAGGVRGGSLRARLAERYFDAAPRAQRLEARRSGRMPVRLRFALFCAEPLGESREVEHVVVKSVHSCLCAEWIAQRFEPTVVVVDRHPLNALASWSEMNQGTDPVEYEHVSAVARRRWSITLPALDAPRIARQAAFLGVLRGGLNEAANRHPKWLRVQHDDLLAAPEASFTRLCDAAGLQFSDASRAYLESANQPGEGYVTKRVAGTLAERWKRTLSEDDIALALQTLSIFPPELGLLDAVEEGLA
jgi:hypothetical protein